MGIGSAILDALGFGDAPPLPKLYTHATLYLNGTKLAETTQVAVRLDAHTSDIETVDMGFAGVSPGASRVIITASNAIPSTDFELHPWASSDSFMGLKKDKKPQDKPVELGVWTAKSSLVTLGWFRTYSITYAVNGRAELSFEFVGFSKPWTFPK